MLKDTKTIIFVVLIAAVGYLAYEKWIKKP